MSTVTPSLSLINNPLLKSFPSKDEVVPFDQIKVEHFIPALHEAIREAKENIEAIKKVVAPTFENSILALEQASEKVDRISNIYFNLFSCACVRVFFLIDFFKE